MSREARHPDGDVRVIHVKEIQSLTEFQRKTRKTIARLKRTGRPAALTVNGQVEIVIQDITSYQRLLARAEEGDRLMELRRSIAEYRAGRVYDMDETVGDLEARHLGKTKST